jgi:hypothetical protein
MNESVPQSEPVYFKLGMFVCDPEIKHRAHKESTKKHNVRNSKIDRILRIKALSI